MKLENISKNYKGRAVIDHVSLALPETGWVVFTGASGSGKSTLLYLISGLVAPDSGRILGTENKTFSFLFQENRLLPWETALGNVSLVSDEPTAEKFLCLLGLEQELSRYPNELSGGMNRRVALARCLSKEADIYILDEPFKGLDLATKKRAMEVTRAHTKEKLTLFVTHDPSEIYEEDTVISLPILPLL